jgi:hypothetical protein
VGTQGTQGTIGTGYSNVTSTTSATPASSGNIALTTNQQGAFVTGNRVRAINTTSNYFEGIVTITGGTTFTIAADFNVGTTPASSWTIALTGVRGVQGTTGTQGTSGTNGTNGSQGASGTNGTNGSQGATGASIQGVQGIQGISPSTADFITNTPDTYTGTAKAMYVVTLSQAQYDAIGTKDPNTLYIII